MNDAVLACFFPACGKLYAGGAEMNSLIEPPSEKMRKKYKAAEAAGLLARVMEVGWAGLTAKESGRIGGMTAHMKHEKDG